MCAESVAFSLIECVVVTISRFVHEGPRYTETSSKRFLRKVFFLTRSRKLHLVLFERRRAVTIRLEFVQMWRRISPSSQYCQKRVVIRRAQPQEKMRFGPTTTMQSLRRHRSGALYSRNTHARAIRNVDKKRLQAAEAGQFRGKFSNLCCRGLDHLFGLAAGSSLLPSGSEARLNSAGAATHSTGRQNTRPVPTTVRQVRGNGDKVKDSS